MTSLRQLEERLRAWQSFRGIAGATRSLAAAQSLHWSEAARRAEEHLQRCLDLRDAYPAAVAPSGASRLVLGLGSDLGLCGPFNRAVADVVERRLVPAPAMVLVVGTRLGGLLDDGLLTLSSPTSFDRVEALARELEALLHTHAPERSRLEIVLAAAVEPDGLVRVETQDEPPPRPGRAPARVELVDPRQTTTAVAELCRHARIVAALARSLASETEARWRTMNRAHEAADRRIGEQERDLRKRRQEQVTQQMLEARQGGRSPSSAS